MKLWILSPFPADCMLFFYLLPFEQFYWKDDNTMVWKYVNCCLIKWTQLTECFTVIKNREGSSIYVIKTKSKDSFPSSCLPKHALRVFTCINFDSINKVSLLVGIVEKVLVYLVDKMSVWKGSVSLRPGKNTRQFENLHFVHCLVSMCSRIWKITNVQNWILIKWQFSF